MENNPLNSVVSAAKGAIEKGREVKLKVKLKVGPKTLRDYKGAKEKGDS